MKMHWAYCFAAFLVASAAFGEDLASSTGLTATLGNDNSLPQDVDAQPLAIRGIDGSSPAIEWSALCLEGQHLLDAGGCTPNCSGTNRPEACNQLFSKSQIEKLSRISPPYHPDGVFVFELDQVGVPSSANLTIQVGAVPADGNGYVCESMYEDGTPAMLINTNLFSSNIIAVDYQCTPYSGTGACKSNNYSNFMSQSNTGTQTYYWYTNPRRPMYLLCLSYIEVGEGSTVLRSTAGCSGSTGSCVYYNLS